MKNVHSSAPKPPGNARRVGVVARRDERERSAETDRPAPSRQHEHAHHMHEHQHGDRRDHDRRHIENRLGFGSGCVTGGAPASCRDRPVGAQRRQARAASRARPASQKTKGRAFALPFAHLFARLTRSLARSRRRSHPLASLYALCADPDARRREFDRADPRWPRRPGQRQRFVKINSALARRARAGTAPAARRLLRTPPSSRHRSKSCPDQGQPGGCGVQGAGVNETRSKP